MTLRLPTVLSALFGVVLVCAGCPSPQYPNCENDEQCQSHHEYCVNSHCQQCRVDAHCPANHHCAGNRCVLNTGACDADSDCPSGQSCQDHACVARPECDEVHTCPGGAPCQEGHCVQPSTNDTGEETSGPVPACLQPVYFAFDNDELDTTARTTLQSDVDCLARNQGNYNLVGHTDPRGTTEYNLALGDRRARAVLRYLVSLGIDQARMGVSSVGSEDATGTDDAGWQHDRRVDFRAR